VGTAPKDQPGEALPLGRVERTRQRVAMLQARRDAVAARAQAERSNHATLDAVYEMVDRDAEFAGGIIAGALAYRLFIWLLPLGLVFVAGLGIAADAASSDPKSCCSGSSSSVASSSSPPSSTRRCGSGASVRTTRRLTRRRLRHSVRPTHPRSLEQEGEWSDDRRGSTKDSRARRPRVVRARVVGRCRAADRGRPAAAGALGRVPVRVQPHQSRSSLACTS
jgi:hypothetical protein